MKLSKKSRGHTFRNDGRPASAKWLDHEKGLLVTFRPALNKRRKTVPTVVFVRTPDRGCGVECLICGTKLLQLPSHINRVHGVSGTEYKERFGAEARLVGDELVALYTERFQEQGERKHLANIRACPWCGKVFRRGVREVARHRRQYCSTECASAALSEQRSRPEYVARLQKIATTAAKRLAYLEKLKADKLADRTRSCIVCDKTFISSCRSKVVSAGVCSLACRSEHMKRKSSMAQRARVAGLDPSVVRSRIKLGWPEEAWFLPSGSTYFRGKTKQPPEGKSA